MSMRTTTGWMAAGFVMAAAAQANAATLAPLATFGGGDGWRAPFEVLPGDAAGTDSLTPGFYNYLGNTVPPSGVTNAGNLERGMAYNPVTGNLILVSRSSAGNGIRILNGTTGVDIGALNQGAAIIAGGTFTTNMVGVADDGAIYVSNLAVGASAGTPFKVYRWASETAVAPTVAFDGTVPPLAGARIGDSFDVIGSGASTRLISGYGKQAALAGTNGFALLTTTNGTTFTGNTVAIATNPPESGDFRLGITFTDADTVYGKQGDSTILTEQDQARIVDLAGNTGTLVGSFNSDGQTVRGLDFKVAIGTPLLVMQEFSASIEPAARARIFVYDQTNPTAPAGDRKIAEGSTLNPVSETGQNQFVNGNSTGSVKFGAVNGNVVTIYAMSTNNGIQAFNLTLDPVVADNADFDADGDVDGNDFLLFQRGLGIVGTATLGDGDANDDNDVDADDLAIFRTQFGTVMATPVAGAVPEPATVALLGLAAMGVVTLGRRRR